mmetsp:Transcript_45613/g.111770  ORF Transcript_45613/g.111770 Transcript_45613/m.111770 type:complete len:238 (-) Transcript_45613:626-1339(-)
MRRGAVAGRVHVVGARVQRVVKLAQVQPQERRRVGERVDTIEKAAVPGQQLAAVFDLQVALQCRHRQVAVEARHAEQPADDGRLDFRLSQRRRREQRREQHAQQRRATHATHHALRALVGRHVRPQPPLGRAERLAGHELRHVVELGDAQHVDDEADAVADGAVEQQRRAAGAVVVQHAHHVRQALHGSHDGQVIGGTARNHLRTIRPAAAGTARVRGGGVVEARHVPRHEEKEVQW